MLTQFCAELRRRGATLDELGRGTCKWENFGMFQRECWYVAMWSGELARALKPLRMLGKDIVMYRTAVGEAVALEDACPHRKLPLSMGSLKEDRIVCGYHGLTFDGRGVCVAAPTQGRVPPNASVKRYPAAERYGLVWVWMGKPENADESLIVDIPNYDSPAWGRTKGGDMPIACDYLYVVDNLLDPSHVAWVHLTSFAGARTQDAPLSISKGQNGVTVWRWIMATEPPAYYAPLLKFKGLVDRKQHYECVLPSFGINMSVYSPAGTGGPDKPLDPRAYINVSYNFITPVDADNSHYFWFQHRNADPSDADVSERMNAGAMAAFLEDRNVLEAVHKGMANKETSNLDLSLDAGALQFRKLVKRRIEAEAAQGRH